MVKQVELTKIISDGVNQEQVRSTRGIIEREEKLKYGGIDGIKRAVLLTLLGREQNRRLWLISKEYDLKDEDELKDIIRSYSVLRKLGLPVPFTTRYYFDKSRKKLYLLMSDITQGGKKLVWGYSDKMTNEQLKTIQKMEITEEDLVTIEASAKQIIEVANEKKLLISSNYYHVARDKATGEISLHLLDVGQSLGGVFPVSDDNDIEFGTFISKLRGYIK